MDNQLDASREALFQAISKDDSKGFNEMLKQGPNVTDRKDPIFGMTALMFAARLGKLEAAMSLVHKSKVSLDAINIHSQTALMLAASNGRTDVADALVLAGANIELQDGHGRTAEMLAKENRVYGIVFKR